MVFTVLALYLVKFYSVVGPYVASNKITESAALYDLLSKINNLQTNLFKTYTLFSRKAEQIKKINTNTRKTIN